MQREMQNVLVKSEMEYEGISYRAEGMNNNMIVLYFYFI